jgi:CheY-like chemotaxis protein
MMRVVVIGWNREEVEVSAAALRRDGFEAEGQVPAGPEFLKALSADPPAVLVIDLERRPASGRDLGLWLRSRKATRNIPLVFAGGDEAKIAETRALLPGASFTPWDTVARIVRQSRLKSTAVQAATASVMAAYVGRPLAQKLGLQAGMKVALVGAPEGFERVLGDLPEGVRLGRIPERRAGPIGEVAGLVLWFVRSQAELETGMAAMAIRAEDGRLWICWPKQGSALAADVTQNTVRKAGLAAGLVDFKICAIDADWSGLCFVRRRPARRKGASGANQIEG